MTRTPSGALRATVKSTESSQLTELADTDPADWNMQQAGAGLATDAPGKEAALLAGEPAKPKVTKETLYSTAKVHSIFNGNGHLGKHFYRFQNVRLTKKSLTFYMKPGGSGPCGGGSLCGTQEGHRQRLCQAHPIAAGCDHVGLWAAL